MTTQTIAYKHEGIAITYNERDNKWEFTLRGRDRSAESLAKAKEIIEKPAPEKAKPFEKIAAWQFGYSDKPERVEVTGVAENPSYLRDRLSVWIKKGTQRSKADAEFRIYPSNPKNDELFNQVIAKMDAITKLKKECDVLRQKLDPLVIAKEEEVK